MNTKRKLAREYLQQASLTNFWSVVKEAKISKADMEILDLRFVEGRSLVSISIEKNMSLEAVNRVIKTAYDKVSRLIGQD